MLALTRLNRPEITICQTQAAKIFSFPLSWSHCTPMSATEVGWSTPGSRTCVDPWQLCKEVLSKINRPVAEK